MKARTVVYKVHHPEADHAERCKPFSERPWYAGFHESARGHVFAGPFATEDEVRSALAAKLAAVPA